MKDHPLGGPHSEKTVKSHILQEQPLSLLAVHLADPLPGGKPWHWLRPRREYTHKTRNLPTEVFFPWSWLSEVVQEGSPCGDLPVVTCLSCSCLIGDVCGITCSKPDSQPTKSDWFWIRPRKGFVLYFSTQEHKRAESGYLLNN